ncbi:YrhK family protein [Alicyclobacillus sp. SO9]|nr:YrhK family protein [Alicyclobacillus sp. SO9]
MEIDNGDETIQIDFKAKRVIIHDRYENLHILNDLLLALWFLVGSVMFFYKHWTYLGTWLFVFGSAQMAIGPMIRMAHKLHIRRFERFWKAKIESAMGANVEIKANGSQRVEEKGGSEGSSETEDGQGESTRQMW